MSSRLPVASLDALLAPRAIAVVGASGRRGSVGNTLLRQLAHGGYDGRLFAVNPRHDEVEGVPCVARLAALPLPVEHVALAVADERVEALLDEAAEVGARAATMFGGLAGDAGGHGRRERVRRLCARHGIALCGGMSMGFYHFARRTWLGAFPTRADHRPGDVTLISQSGSAMAALTDCDARLDFNLAVSSGLELGVTLEDYLDYARKRGGFGPELIPTGNVREDMDEVRAFYADVAGKYPEKFGEIRLKEEA